MAEFYVDARCSDFGVCARAYSSARPNGLRDSVFRTQPYKYHFPSEGLNKAG